MSADSASARVAGHHHGRRDAEPLVVAVAYVLTWVVGLAIGAPLLPRPSGPVWRMPLKAS